MKILFLGTGPSREVVRKGRRNTRTNSSAIIFSSDKKLLIDCTPSFEKQIKRENIDDIDAVIISHAHSDAVNGLPQLNKLLKLKNKKIPLYAESQTIKKIKEKFKTLSNLEFTELELNKSESILGLNVIPFRVIHYEGFPSDGREFPTIGLRIENKYKIVYAEDMESIPKESEKYFRDLDYLMIDAAMYFGKQIRGHMNVQDAFEVIKKYKPRVGILLQAGRTYPDYEKAVNEIRDKWYEYRGDLKTEIHLSFDGMTINPDSELSEHKEEFELKQAFGSPGGKSAIAKKIVGLIPPHRIYTETFAGGLAVFFNKPKAEINVINDKDPEIAFAYRFLKNINEEKINRLKRFDWSPSETKFNELKDLKPKDDVERFYRFFYLLRRSYGFNRTHFSITKPINLDRLLTVRDKLKNTEIYNKDYKEVMRKYDSKDTFHYLDPPYPGEWPNEKSKGKPFSFTKEDLVDLRDFLRSIKGKFILSINSSPENLELFKEFNIKKLKFKRTLPKAEYRKSEYELLVSNFPLKKTHSSDVKLIENINEYSPDEIDSKEVPEYSESNSTENSTEYIKEEVKLDNKMSNQEVYENVRLKQKQLKDIVLIKDCVSVVGSSVKQYGKEREPNDVDLLIRLDPKYDYLRRAIDTRFNHMHDKVHTIYEPLGPFDDYIPLYDLVLKRINTEDSEKFLVQMKQEIDLRSLRIEPLKPVIPMKPQKRFYDINDLAEYIFRGKELK